ncbi:MAG: hypothetical protein MUF22_01560 [Chitinispirillaceae bacterium]|jgi:hypothetical protein|nr:hypothetical protein [Chitinispirillaceae bacterium]
MRRCLVLAAAFLVAGCASRVPLTTGLIREYGLSGSDITKLQLYVSDGLLLEKRITTIDQNIDSSSYGLKKVEDYYVKQVYVKKGTPCIAMSPSTSRVAVAFEQPGDNLIFSVSSAPAAPAATFVYEPDRNNRRDTIADRPRAAGFYKWKITGEETYGDTVFTALVRNRMPILLVDKTGLKKTTINARKVRGLKQAELKGQ